ncbi:FHA domain-containing protein [bacterium]|nr:FHA domain-containing protein [bacterium]
MKRTILFLVLGAIGGFIGWAVLEPMALIPSGSFIEVYKQDALFGAVMGLFIGASLGLGYAIWQGKRLSYSVTRGALIGAIGGMWGLIFGEGVFQIFLPPPSEESYSLFPMMRLVIARSIGWMVVGAIVGLSQGILTRSRWRAKKGALGGAVGGFLGGLLFDFLGVVSAVFLPFLVRGKEAGMISRMVALTSIGGLVGFFSALVEEISKRAWLKVLSGRKEGREYIVDKDEFSIGRDELCDLGLFGDNTILPRHALITRRDGTYEIKTLGGTILVNGQAVSSALLRDGDRLQIGSYHLLFQMKEKVAVKDVAGKVAQPPPLPADICPYCGQKKDPVTGACACTPIPTTPKIPSKSVAQEQTSVVPPKPAPIITAKGGRIIIVKGPRQGEVFPITKKEFTIGRADDRDIMLPDRSVSRRHCKIVLEEDGYYIIDEGSTNGTFIENMRIVREKLKNGDIIQIGECKLKFEE